MLLGETSLQPINLKFIFPNREFYVVQDYSFLYKKNIKNELEEQYEDDYIGDLKTLQKFVSPKIYICHQRSTEDTSFKKFIRNFLYYFGIGKDNDIGNGACARSWVWNNPDLNFQKIMQEGRYEAYLVTIK